MRNKITFPIFLIFLLTGFSNLFAQLDTIHYLPPMHSADAGQITDHYVYFSTLETTTFTVTITSPAGKPIAQIPLSKAAPATYTIATNDPSIVMVSRDSLYSLALGQPLKQAGLKMTAPKPFFANFRARSNAQAELITCKGNAAMGKTFRAGVVPMGNSEITNYTRNFFTSCIATEDSTTIIVSDYDPGVTFTGPGTEVYTSPALTIVMDEGESVVLSGYMDVVANEKGFVGALIEADKPIVVNNGNWCGTIGTNNGNQDIMADQTVPIDWVGTEYVLVKGAGTVLMERPLVIAHHDNTQISTAGAYLTTINAGEYFLIDNSYYSAGASGNMYVTTSQPAYMYQPMGGAAAEQTSGMNFIPPLSCFFPNEVFLPSVHLIGATTYSASVVALTQSTATLTINGAVQSGAQAIAGLADWVTYKITGAAITGNLDVVSTGPVAVGAFGFSNAAGFAGYYSGFGAVPPITYLSVDCAPGVILTSSDEFTGYQWIYDGVALPGETGQTLVANIPGYYKVEVSKATCTDTSNAYYVPACPTESGVSKFSESVVTSSPNVYDITYKSVIENFGSGTIFNAQATDTLTFPSCAVVTVLAAPTIISGGTILSPGSPNSAFQPGIDNRLLLGIDRLASGAVDTISYTLRIDMTAPGCQGAIVNEIFLSGKELGPNNGIEDIYTYTEDISQEGKDPDPNGNGIPDETEPTVVCLPPVVTSISYPSNGVYPSTVTTQTVTLTGWTAGTYSAQAGLTLNAVTGDIDPSTSTLGTYTVTYAFGTSPCDGIATAIIIIDSDYDGDGVADVIDPDDDNDGILDAAEGTGDKDGDGIPNSFDLDSDNDGISDVIEAGGSDPDGDGIIGTVTFIDTDGDGIADAIDTDNGGAPLSNPDTDGDRLANALDIDSDRDGIVDNIEAQSTAGYVLPSGTDSDGDGTDDSYDIDNGGIAIVPVNTDGVDNPDYIDVDTDNDGYSDIIEGNDFDNDNLPDVIALGTDADGDGLDDVYDNVSTPGITNITNADAPPTGTTFPNVDTPDAELDWRTSVDTDEDGVGNNIDIDDDNDGISDVTENATALNFGDTDGDGVLDALDLDSDNDGISDVIEAGGSDPDGDGIIGASPITDADNDGLLDIIDNVISTGLPGVDTDLDGVPDFQELDSDDDNIHDVDENGNELLDVDNDGMVDGSDADNDGIKDLADSNDAQFGGFDNNNPNDTDSDNLPDYRDLDSDDDTISDKIEAGDTDLSTNPIDTDTDGIADFRDIDSDGDGLSDKDEWDFDLNGIGPDDCDQDDVPDYLDADPCGFSIPEGFSPNGDGVNDFFIIKGIGLYPQNNLVIYNRWGSKVFESTPYKNDWNGSNSVGLNIGDDLLPGTTYFYVFDAGDGRTEVITGYVHIVK